MVNNRCVGYYGFRTAWGWRCDPDAEHAWAVLERERSIGVAHQWLPLGSWVEIHFIDNDSPWTKSTANSRTVLAPVTDRGPYAPWGDAGGFDLQEPLIRAMNWSVEVGWYKVRVLDIPRYCPAQGAEMPNLKQLIVEMGEGDPRATALFSAAVEWARGSSSLPSLQALGSEWDWDS